MVMFQIVSLGRWESHKVFPIVESAEQKYNNTYTGGLLGKVKTSKKKTQKFNFWEK